MIPDPAHTQLPRLRPVTHWSPLFPQLFPLTLYLLLVFVSYYGHVAVSFYACRSCYLDAFAVRCSSLRLRFTCHYLRLQRSRHFTIFARLFVGLQHYISVLHCCCALFYLHTLLLPIYTVAPFEHLTRFDYLWFDCPTIYRRLLPLLPAIALVDCAFVWFVHVWRCRTPFTTVHTVAVAGLYPLCVCDVYVAHFYHVAHLPEFFESVWITGGR